MNVRVVCTNVQDEILSIAQQDTRNAEDALGNILFPKMPISNEETWASAFLQQRPLRKHILPLTERNLEGAKKLLLTFLRSISQ